MSEPIQDLIIGAGAIGVNCAYFLAKSGRAVALVDQGTVCSGCSHGNAGWVTPCHSLPLPGPGLVAQTLKWMLRGDSPLYIKPSLHPSLLAWLWRFFKHCNLAAQLKALKPMADLNRHVIPMTQELIESNQLDCQFQQRGIMYVFRSEAEFKKGIQECEFLVEHGIVGCVLNAEEVRASEPVVDDSVCGGVLYPDDADVVPDQFVKELANCLPHLGIRILSNTRVERFDVSSGSITGVATSAGLFRPDNVVLAAGAWTSTLARRLGIRLSMLPGKGYSITFKKQPGVPQKPINLSEAKVAVTPWRDTIRLAGTMELAGFQLKINQRRVDAIIKAAKTYLPSFRAEQVLEVWAGMRPVTSDGLPIIGRTSRLSNLIVATGHGMLGLTQSVVTGRSVADLVNSRAPLFEMKPFSPDRF